MKLTILTQYYPPEVGAPQARLAELAAFFTERGHEVTVLTAMPSYPAGRVHDGYGGLWRRERLDGVNVLRSFVYPTQRAEMVPRMASYLSFVGSSAAVGTALLDRSDYLLVESPPLFLGLAGVWLSRLKRARLIFNVSDLWPESAVRLGVVRDAGLPHRVAGRLESFCYDRSWLISGQSLGIVADIERRFPGRRTYHLSNGVDARKFGPERRTADARALLGGEEGCVVLYAGLHGLAQGLAQLLEAAAALSEVLCDVRFVLCGDGPEKAALRGRAGELGLDNVRFLDPQPRHAMPALAASADVVVVPLRLEIPGAVPSKLYEAMASGRPVVLAAAGESADIVRRHEAGIVVPPGDAVMLARAVRELAGSPDLRARLGANGRRAAEAHYDRATIGSRFASYLESHLESHLESRLEPRLGSRAGAS